MDFDALLSLSPAGAADRWTAPGIPPNGVARLFGGVLLGQAVLAACHGTRRCHSLHALFLDPGAEQERFELAVERMRDGSSFSARRIEIRQRDRLLLMAHSSHHDGDAGPDHQAVMPDVPGPEGLEDQRDTGHRRAEARGIAPLRFLGEQMLEVRPTGIQVDERNGREAEGGAWFRPRRRVGETPSLHQAVIAFASDMRLVRVGLRPLRKAGTGDRLQTTSLDHTIRFHREVSANDWLLHVERSPIACHGRGYAEAAIFSRDGRLVANVGQAFLARYERSRSNDLHRAESETCRLI